MWWSRRCPAATCAPPCSSWRCRRRSMATTWSTASDGCRGVGGDADGPASIGCGPAAATSPPMLTNTPQRARRRCAARRGRRRGPWPKPRGRCACRRAPAPFDAGASSSIRHHPGGGPGAVVELGAVGGRARRSHGRTPAPRGQSRRWGPPPRRCVGPTSQATRDGVEEQGAHLHGASPPPRCRLAQLGVRPEAAAGDVDGDELFAQDLSARVDRRRLGDGDDGGGADGAHGAEGRWRRDLVPGSRDATSTPMLRAGVVIARSHRRRPWPTWTSWSGRGGRRRGGRPEWSRSGGGSTTCPRPSSRSSGGRSKRRNRIPTSTTASRCGRAARHVVVPGISLETMSPTAAVAPVARSGDGSRRPADPGPGEVSASRSCSRGTLDRAVAAPTVLGHGERGAHGCACHHANLGDPRTAG